MGTRTHARLEGGVGGSAGRVAAVAGAGQGGAALGGAERPAAGLIAGQVTLPATLAKRHEAASRGEFHTAVAAAGPGDEDAEPDDHEILPEDSSGPGGPGRELPLVVLGPDSTDRVHGTTHARGARPDPTPGQFSEEHFEVLDLMERMGGSFVSALAAAWRKADGTNHRLLYQAFGHYYRDYAGRTARPGSRRAV